MKRLFALLLCLVMALSLIPAAAAEEIEIIEVDEEEEELDAPEEGEEIRIIDVDQEDGPLTLPNGSVTINAANFPDAHFRSYVSDHFDANGDGVLSASEIANATYIECVFEGIESFEGIEYLTALKELCFENNPVYSLDVSNNKELVYLDANMTPLSSLDVSQNTKLESLSVGNTHLTSLDISKNTALQDFYSEYTGFEVLDVSNCPGLLFLITYGERLEHKGEGPWSISYEYMFDEGDEGTKSHKLWFDWDTTLIYKPTITTQPVSKTAAENETVKFTVKATGASSYQWQYRTSSTGTWYNSTLTGAKTATVSVPATSARNGFQYRCKVSNLADSVFSNTATLTVGAKPVITTQPTSKTVNEGTTAKFTVTATGAESYQWQYRTGSTGTWYNSTLTGAKTATVSVPATAARNGFQYRCKVTNAAGSVLTNTVTLTVNSIVSKPVITTQPTSKTVGTGTMAVFTVIATGATSYQWQVKTDSGWVNINNPYIEGTTTATMTVPATAGRNGNQYRCMLTNTIGSVYSNTVILTVVDKPVITTQPASKTVNEGTTAKFTVAATGATSYQWQYRTGSTGTWNTCTLTGAKTATLTVPATMARNGYQYRCQVTNAGGTTISNAATLTVKSTTPKPVITTQPTSKTVSVGTMAVFAVVATGATSYQWQVKTDSGWVDVNNPYIEGAESATMSVPASAERNGNQYRCKVANASGSVYTDTVKLTVISKPTITSQPSSASVTEGSTVKFKVVATGTGLSYQWQYRTGSTGTWYNSTLTGAKTATVSVPATAARNGFQYRCKITNAAGTVYTVIVTLTVK